MDIAVGVRKRKDKPDSVCRARSGPPRFGGHTVLVTRLSHHIRVDMAHKGEQNGHNIQ